jgi:hypothetical protein
LGERTGRFERHDGPDGREVFRLRWDNPNPLSALELGRLAFVRHLLRTGRLSESPQEPAE